MGSQKEIGAAALVDGATYRAGDPFAIWKEMREHEPVCWQETPDFGDFWSLTRYEEIDRVLRDADAFSSAAGILLRPTGQGPDPGSGRTMALSDSERHRDLRTAIAGWFAPRNLRRLADALDVVATAIVTEALEKPVAEFVAEVAARLPLEVVWTLLDIPRADRGDLTRWSMDAFCSDTAAARSIGHLEILDYFTGLAAERRRHPGEDLVSVLSGVRVAGRVLTVEETVLNCDNLLVGGTENVRLAMAGGVAALIDNPRQWLALQDDFERVAPTAVDEILRWTSSATHLMRTARHDVRLRGRHIRKGDRVVMWLPSGNRDGERFRDPEILDLSRTPNRHVSLGAGPHICVGVQLAKLELGVVLRHLTQRVRSIERRGTAERLESIVVNGFRTLPVRLEARGDS
ncbi:cytochrome P450 [Streptomyces sp. PTM05]|uniref:Cytochrome P450 n=1 Tax=Streptantibioticus parmotrematis TaxID=2873249 RepID=A0ABS7QWD2_9ACTN|nr:cytochrome P450 [Streptantibioticus parmotrematis]MBY8887011.1 cytochrome P450 [Streptantibioticus parmotrematis]